MRITHQLDVGGLEGLDGVVVGQLLVRPLVVRVHEPTNIELVSDSHNHFFHFENSSVLFQVKVKEGMRETMGKIPRKLFSQTSFPASKNRAMKGMHFLSKERKKGEIARDAGSCLFRVCFMRVFLFLAGVDLGGFKGIR